MFQTMLIKFLTSEVAAALAKKVVIALLEHLVKKTDNTLDDEVVAVVKEALGEK